MTEPTARCPWCSAELPDPTAEACPSCGATLTSTSGPEPQLPGVTTLDAEAILRARSEVGRPRSRILSFITGEVVQETGGPTSPESLAPPSSEVRREMLRLQIEAERADLEAEQIALKADVLAEAGIPLSELAAEADASSGGAEPPSTAADDAAPADGPTPAEPPAP